MRETLEEELHALQASLLQEGELVLRALRGSINSLRENDPELADEVIAFDDDVDALYLELQRGIEALLARQNPVAGDLRFVLAVLHSNLHLERMADLCVTIAKLTKLAHGLPPEETLVEGFDEMASRADSGTTSLFQSAGGAVVRTWWPILDGRLNEPAVVLCGPVSPSGARQRARRQSRRARQREELR